MATSDRRTRLMFAEGGWSKAVERVNDRIDP